MTSLEFPLHSEWLVKFFQPCIPTVGQLADGLANRGKHRKTNRDQGQTEINIGDLALERPHVHCKLFLESIKVNMMFERR